MGRDSSIGIATSYGLGGPGIESRLVENYQNLSIPAWAHLVSCKMGSGSLSQRSSDRCLDLATNPI